MPFKPPYFQAESIAEGVRRMTPTTWPVVIGFATTASLLMFVHSKLSQNPSLRAKSGYLAQIEAAKHGGHHPAAHHGHH